MADFDQDKAKRDQNYILERTDEIYKALKNEVVDYYWEREPEDEAEDIDNAGAIRRYLRRAHDQINELLEQLDRRFE